MFSTTPLLATLLLAISIVASPVDVRSSFATLPFAKRINTSGGAINLVQQDQARAIALRDHGYVVQGGGLDRREPGNVPVIASRSSSDYILSVGIGNPPTTYDLIIDFTSANLWIGSDKPYTPTTASKDTGQPVGCYLHHTYWNGEEWLDTVDLGSGMVIKDQSIGVASSTYGYDTSADGVLGLGPSYLTVGTLWSQLQVVFPNVLDNLYDQGTIPEDVFSVFLSPSTSGNDVAGEFTFGGTDSSKYTGQITYAPITTTKPSSFFWGIDQTIIYGNQTIMPQGAGVVDTRTSLILIPISSYHAYKSATGGTEDEATGMLRLTTSQYSNLQDLVFMIADSTFTLTPNGQIWPRALNTYIGGNTGAIYLVVINGGAHSGSGLDFTLGQVFLERFYSVFDGTRQRVGFATTSYTEATTN